MTYFIYRNRADDDRTIDQLHFCSACGGFYGVPHTNNHCQEGLTSRWRPENCACRFCKEATGRPVTGPFGTLVTLCPECDDRCCASAVALPPRIDLS